MTANGWPVADRLAPTSSALDALRRVASAATAAVRVELDCEPGSGSGEPGVAPLGAVS